MREKRYYKGMKGTQGKEKERIMEIERMGYAARKAFNIADE